MTDKLSMSLDDIVKGAQKEKKAKQEPAGKGGNGGGKGKKDKKKDKPQKTIEKKAPQEKREKKEKAPREKKERPPADPSPLVFVGGLPWTIEAAAVEEALSAVAPCKVDMKMRVRGGESRPAGFAIATFESTEAATEAIEKLNETELGGRKMIVRFASPE